MWNRTTDPFTPKRPCNTLSRRLVCFMVDLAGVEPASRMPFIQRNYNNSFTVRMFIVPIHDPPNGKTYNYSDNDPEQFHTLI